MRISDWSSDVCSSDLHLQTWQRVTSTPRFLSLSAEIETYSGGAHGMQSFDTLIWDRNRRERMKPLDLFQSSAAFDTAVRDPFCAGIERAKAARGIARSEEHTSELQSLMRISYAVFCLKKKKNTMY